MSEHRWIRWTKRAVVGAASAALAAFVAYGIGGRDPPALDGARSLRAIHWNVRWGGDPGRDAAGWDGAIEELVSRRPGLILLTEAPARPHVDRLAARLGSWNVAMIDGAKSEPYWYALAILSPEAISVRWSGRVPGGSALCADVGELRVLLVDAVSLRGGDRSFELGPLLDRLGPMTIIAGDFNEPAAIAFDVEDRYRLVGPTCGWRYSWPSFLPMIDLDHVLVARQHGWSDCRLFSAPVSDHRATMIDLNLTATTFRSE